MDHGEQLAKAAETALVRRAQREDTDAFGELVRLHQRRSFAVAYRLLGNREDAADVCQDAFVRAFQNLKQLDDPARFGGWLMRVVCNLSLNFRRSRKRRSAAALDDALDHGAELRSRETGRPLASNPAGNGGALPQELSEAIAAAMAELPEKQRLALVLFSVEGMPQKDVAEVLECSIELVKWNVFQARRKLKEALAEYMT